MSLDYKTIFHQYSKYPNEFVYVSTCVSVCSIVYLINLFDWFFIKQKFLLHNLHEHHSLLEMKKFLWHFDYETWYCCEYCLKAYHTIRYEMTENIYLFSFLFIYEAFYIQRGIWDDLKEKCWKYRDRKLKTKNFLNFPIHFNWKFCAWKGWYDFPFSIHNCSSNFEFDTLRHEYEMNHFIIFP